ncbi:type II toxin-antitoxin system VapC family toxin [Candidatus Pacearchaeota archaeon]|nr:type II toxin-antitoxin system VapC family toxin [Candidatus Pacearchaeota archaeon]
MGICLDSTVIIDFLNGRKEAIAIVGEFKDKDSLFTTEINVFEVLFGIYLKKVVNEEELDNANNFFNALDVLSFDDGCGSEAVSLQASLVKSAKMIEQADIFISAIIKKNGFSKIITRNKNHFSRIDGIEVINY